jgi:hypothetical protein
MLISPGDVWCALALWNARVAELMKLVWSFSWFWKWRDLQGALVNKKSRLLKAKYLLFLFLWVVNF